MARAGEGFAPSVGTGRAKVTKDCLGSWQAEEPGFICLPAQKRREAKEQRCDMPGCFGSTCPPPLPFHNLAVGGGQVQEGFIAMGRVLRNLPGFQEDRAGWGLESHTAQVGEGCLPSFL